MSWLPWVLFPAIGATIGYLTNWVAIKMLFHPRKRTCGMQGLIPRRQEELAKRIGQVVGADVIHLDKLAAPLKDADLRPLLDGLIANAMANKVQEWQSIPLVGAFITEERVASIRDSIIDEVVNNQDELIQQITEFAEKHINIADIAEQQIIDFDLDRLETVANQVARTEFRSIEIWGAVLGVIIGLVQVGILYLLELGAAT